LTDWDDRFKYCEDCGRQINKQVASGTCPDCGGKMVRAEEYEPYGVFCEICGQQNFKTDRGLENHKTRVHS